MIPPAVCASKNATVNCRRGFLVQYFRIWTSSRLIVYINSGIEWLALFGFRRSRRSGNYMNIAKKILRFRFKLLWGTPRRLLWSICRPGYVSASLTRRHGKCRRCGTCCRLVWRCRFFHYDQGLPACKLYGHFRFPNCSHFPIDQRDLNDRDLVSPYTTCGFWWIHEKNNEKQAQQPDQRPELQALHTISKPETRRQNSNIAPLPENIGL